MFTAKETNTAVFIIGHVTKEGAIAGPRVLEHIVDTVLYFEGEGRHTYRILRAVKNRFGSTNEIGVFEMKETGLAEVGNPSNLFLAERPQKATGSVVIATMEGTRPILVELQALVSATNGGLPRRTSIGVDHHRVSLLLAVLEKRLGIPLQQNDVYVNMAGGIRIEEPAIDLGIVAAVLSSLKEHPIEPTVLLFGEVGLGGEVRAVTHSEQRIREAQKMGFTRCLLPDRNYKQLKGTGAMEFCGVEDIAEAFEILFT
jgi:DNA repair protein RadA/Sms